ncbi:hypothetical protein CPC08DRAFT_762892 [Agrocybe pediades]|nr:hypothetical protein CPC08DRAFT_762892 [Agrocybe pediades]
MNTVIVRNDLLISMIVDSPNTVFEEDDDEGCVHYGVFVHCQHLHSTFLVSDLLAAPIADVSGRSLWGLRPERLTIRSGAQQALSDL